MNRAVILYLSRTRTASEDRNDELGRGSGTKVHAELGVVIREKFGRDLYSRPLDDGDREVLILHHGS